MESADGATTGSVILLNVMVGLRLLLPYQPTSSRPTTTGEEEVHHRHRRRPSLTKKMQDAQKPDARQTSFRHKETNSNFPPISDIGVYHTMRAISTIADSDQSTMSSPTLSLETLESWTIPDNTINMTLPVTVAIDLLHLRLRPTALLPSHPVTR